MAHYPYQSTPQPTIPMVIENEKLNIIVSHALWQNE
ncbi:hypothetical protein ACHAXH_002892 [Discostella pseudostelligera]